MHVFITTAGNMTICDIGVDNTFTVGLTLSAPHLTRDSLITAISEKLRTTSVVVIAGPPGSGKSALLSLYTHQYCKYSTGTIKLVTLLHDEDPRVTLLREANISLTDKTTPFDAAVDNLVVLDECQLHLADRGFWQSLLRDSSAWMPPTVRFLLSTTSSLNSLSDSPLIDSTAAMVSGDDLRLSDSEATALLELPYPHGLIAHLRDPAVVSTIVRASAGLVAAVRIFTNELNTYHHSSKCSVEEAIMYLCSDRMTSSFARCFPITSKDVESAPEVLQQLLLPDTHQSTDKNSGIINPVVTPTTAEMALLARLDTLGILRDNRITSRIAARFVAQMLR